MADFTDVANALVSLVAGVVYPNGTGAASIANAPITVFQGWPNPPDLDKAMAAGKLQISVWPTPTERLVQMRTPEWQEVSVTAPTVTLTVAANTVTVGGAAAAGQNVAVLVDGKPYVHAVQTGDTLTTIATALAVLISADRPATSAGTVVTIPDAHTIVARAGGTGTSIRELRRQEKVFQISVWANCHEKRDPVASKVDAALAGIYRLSLPDGTQGILRYRSSNQIDNTQKNGIYRRDLLYAVEYAVTESRTDTQIVTGQTSIGVEPLEGSPAVGQITISS